MQELLRDLRLVSHRLAKSPGFTAASLFTLALGIGASTAIFSVVEGVVLSPLPYPASDRLVTLGHSIPGAEIPSLGLSSGTFLHYLEHSRTLEEIAIYEQVPANLTGHGGPRHVRVAPVSGSFFSLFLEGAPLLGRVLGPSDDQPGANRVAVISHRLWRQQLSGDPGVLGRNLRLDGTAYQVVGVLPRGFDFPSSEVEVWTALQLDPDRATLDAFYLSGVGRLREGSSLEQAREELQGLIARLSEPYPGSSYELIVERGRLTLLMTDLKEQIVGEAEAMLWILFATAGFVLLIACANVANLFLVRSAARAQEMAVRRALGAGSGRIARLFLVESVTLGLLGALGGLLLAVAAVDTLEQLNPSAVPRLQAVEINLAMFAVAAGLGVLSGLAFGLLPVVHRRSRALIPALKNGGRTIPSGRRYGTRDLLVVSQVALALTLLVGAGLMARSFQQLREVDPGFDATSTLSFRLSLPPDATYPDRAAAARLHQQVLDELASLPGVRQVGAVDCLPLTGCDNAVALTVEGARPSTDRPAPSVEARGVTAGYFQAMGISLLAGRALEHRDSDRQTGAAVVSRTLAERRWPGRSPIGERIFPAVSDDPAWYTVVGVVEDVHSAGLTAPADELAYFPLVGTRAESWASHSLAYVVRAGSEPLALVGPIRNAIAQLDPDLPLADLRLVEDVLRRAQAPTAFAMLLLSVAAATSLILGLVGVYGALSYRVDRRRREIGMRMALGAQARDVRWMILRHGAGMTALGISLGLAAAAILTRWMSSLVFGITTMDLATYSVVTAGLLVAALLAALLPARRATHQDPAEILRSE